MKIVAVVYGVFVVGDHFLNAQVENVMNKQPLLSYSVITSKSDSASVKTSFGSSRLGDLSSNEDSRSIESITPERSVSGIRLVQPVEKDADWILENLNADICASLACAPCTTRSEAIAYLSLGYVTKLIRHDREGIVGVCGYQRLIGQELEIFYWVADRFRQKGYAFEALTKLLEYAGAVSNVILAEIFVDNEFSIRLIEKLNFKLVQHGFVNGRKTNIYRKHLRLR